MNINSIEIMNKGLECLTLHLGAKEAELFIATMLRERFDYTKWHQNFVGNIKTFDDLDDLLVKTEDKAKFSGRAKITL